MHEIKEAPASMFIPNLTLELIGARFNHCSTICRYKNGILTAWYGGTRECEDDQSVFLLYIDKNGTSKPLQLNPKTGNPVLWNEGDKTYLLWSRFEDSGPIERLADRWKYCSLWMIELTVEGDEIWCEGDEAYVKIPHLLGRCNPISWQGQTFIPLYDELNRHGVILGGHNLTFNHFGNVGENMIQPTLWVEGDRICSLSRTFHSPHRSSQFSYSTDGITWSPPELTEIPNRNSSLHALVWHGYPLLLWNDTTEVKRKNLTLGVIEGGVKVRPLFRVNSYGSYPSMCEDSDGNLCLSYTNAQSNIFFHTWEREQLLVACRGGHSS